jgi:hypothetical protein
VHQATELENNFSEVKPILFFRMIVGIALFIYHMSFLIMDLQNYTQRSPSLYWPI